MTTKNFLEEFLNFLKFFDSLLAIGFQDQGKNVHIEWVTSINMLTIAHKL